MRKDDTVAMEIKLQQLLEKRTKNGAFFYVGIWLLIGFVTDYSSTNPTIYWSIAALLGVFVLSRQLCCRKSDNIRSTNLKLWYYLFIINSLAPPLIYGCLFSLSLTNIGSELFIYLLMTVLGMLGGGSVTFSPSRKLTVYYLFVLSSPALVTAMLSPKTLGTEGLLLFIYIVFVFFQSRILYKEYQERIEQRQELESLARMDSLTHIYNRRFFDESFSLYWKSHLRDKKPLGLILIDIDNFKKVNDTHGHPAGDKVIQQVASTIKNLFQRETDIVARLGGEEFAVLLPDPDADFLKDLANTIREQVAQNPATVESESIGVTVSIGTVLTIPKLNSNYSSLYKRADNCLYQAKEQGRNRVSFQSDLTSPEEVI